MAGTFGIIRSPGTGTIQTAIPSTRTSAAVDTWA